MYQPIILGDYKHLLTPYRRYSNRYWCPDCNCHNLTFSPEGKWMCWNNPTREHRLEIMARLIPEFKRSVPRQSESVTREVIPNIHPLQIGYPLITDEVLSEIDGNRIHYLYGNCQRVVRINIPGDKIIRPQYLQDGNWIKGAGDGSWCPYGLSRLLPYPGVVNLILVVEGQKCVEIAHHRGIPALCLEGGDYSQKTTFDKLRAIRDRFERLLLAVLPDKDLPGTRKAKQIIHTARYFSLPTLLLDPLKIDPGLAIGGDIEQMVDFDADRFTRIVKQMLSRK